MTAIYQVKVTDSTEQPEKIADSIEQFLDMLNAELVNTEDYYFSTCELRGYHEYNS